MTVAIKVNNYRDGFRDLSADDRIRFCFNQDTPHSRYIEVFFDQHGQLWLAADESIVLQCHSSNRAVVIPTRIGGGSVTQRLDYPAPGRPVRSEEEDMDD